MNACNLPSCAAMRASSASTTVTGDSRRAAISAARRWAGRKLGSVLAACIFILLRIEAAVDPRRADIVSHEGADALAPRVAVAGPLPGRALGDAGVLELVERQIFRLAIDRDEAAGTEAA